MKGTGLRQGWKETGLEVGVMAEGAHAESVGDDGKTKGNPR